MTLPPLRHLALALSLALGAGCASAPVAPPAAPPAQAAAKAAVVDVGELAGAGYRIDIPEGWQGDLVVYARGYVPVGTPREEATNRNDEDAWALAQGNLAPWSVVCTSPTDAPMAPADDARHLLEHCAWCHLQHQLLAPPPAAMAMHSPALRDVVPKLFPQAPRPLPTWATAQARAPPTLAG